MLVTVKTNPEELSQYPDTESLEELFAELARASLRGHHYVVIDRDTADWAKTNLTLDTRTSAQLEYLKSKYTQDGQLCLTAFCKLSVVLGEMQPTNSSTNPHWHEIGHQKLLRGDYLNPSLLLLEHATNDGALVKQLVAIGKHVTKISHHNCEVQHGGGSSAYAEYERLISQKKVITCFVDSDKFTPSCGLSATNKKLSKAYTDKNIIGILSFSKGKEIENYIPLDLIRSHNIRPEYKQFDELEKIQETGQVDIWLYFDLKLGISKDKLKTYKISSEKKDWLAKNFLSTNANVAGFGENIMDSFLKCHEASKELNKRCKSPDWLEKFGSEFVQLYWYFITEKPKATKAS